MLAKGKLFLLLIGHPPCYSNNIQSSPVRGLAVIEERKHPRKNDPLSFEIWIFRNGQPDCDDDRIIFVAMTPPYEQRSLV